jgi:hypothetical protein
MQTFDMRRKPHLPSWVGLMVGLGCSGARGGNYTDPEVDARPEDAGISRIDCASDAQLGQCSPAPPDQNGPFTIYNQMAVESGCVPPGFLGAGRVRTVEKSDIGGVYLIGISLDTPGTCDGAVPADLSIIKSRTSWQLKVGSEVRVKTFGPGGIRFTPGRLGAVVSMPDGDLLAAAFDQSGDFLQSFVEALPFTIAFQSECAIEPPSHDGAFCYESATRESMVLPTGQVLREGDHARVGLLGATFHVFLRYARNNVGSTGRCSSELTPSEGRTYQFHILRLPNAE